MSKTIENLDEITWDALRTGEIVIDGITYDVWGSKELEEAWSGDLDDSYPEIRIGESLFYPSTIIKNCDAPAYRDMMNAHADSVLPDRILVYGYTLADAVMNAYESVETLNTSYSVNGVNA